jgi:hypothetical protein
MAARDPFLRSDPGWSLPAFSRLAPPLPPELVAARIEANSRPGDVVVDLHGRGGWIARTAVDRQRRAASLETSPLTRLLAEVVLRPPDVRHLDAAFQAIAAAPREQSALKVWLGERYASRCLTCGRAVTLEEVVWESSGDEAPRPITKQYRCIVCRDQLGGGEQRHGPVDEADVARTAEIAADIPARRMLRERFPYPEGESGIVDSVLDLHTPRQLLGLHAILERIETDLRAPAVEAAMRLALLHAILPASRLNGYPGRISTLRISHGRVKLPGGGQWRERNPWLAFEDAYRLVRGFVQRLEGAPLGPMQARFGEDFQALAEGTGNVVLRLGTPSTFRALAAEAEALGRAADRPRIRLVLGQPPLRPNQERLSFAYVGTAWVLGREAASLVPIEALLSSTARVPWGWQSAQIRRAYEAAAPILARDARAILILEPGGPEGLLAAVLGGVGAGYRLVAARLAEPGEETGGIVEFVPPGAAIPVGPRTRANISLPAVPGGPGDPDLVPGRGLFAPPERFDRGRFSEADVARTVTETAVAILQARGEPARTERLLGEILVGLDRAGHLRRLVAPEVDGGSKASDPAAGGPGEERVGEDRSRDGRPAVDRPGRVSDRGRDRLDGSPERPSIGSDGEPGVRHSPRVGPGSLRGSPASAGSESVRAPEVAVAADRVERLLALVRAELARPDHRRLKEIEPDRWWLTDRDDVAAAALPLADRVEWSVFSLLSTAGRLSEGAFNERIAGLFTGHDLPDEALVGACLESYRSLASTPDRVLTSDDLLRRSQEHSELIALLANLGHQLGLRVWISSREQVHRLGRRNLAGWLDDSEFRSGPPHVGRARSELIDQVDVTWHFRARLTMLFEVEWTAMLGEPLLRRGGQIPADPDLVRFLVVAPERTELIRYKLERSPLLRSALEAGNWHILKANHLRAFAERDQPLLADLEPFLGLDPAVERQAGEQTTLFGG